jgi:hypothetical protein
LPTKFFENSLDTNAYPSHTPLAPVTAFPQERSSVPSYPRAGKIKVDEEYRCLHIWRRKPL